MDRFSLFSTPLFVFDLPDMEAINRELTERLVAESVRSRGFSRSNVGGWHSVPDLGLRSEHCYRQLMQMMTDVVDHVTHSLAVEAGSEPPVGWRYGLQAWAMVMRTGDYTALHDHGDAHWSLVYYADAGDADRETEALSGQLALVGPRHGGRPIAGVELFPSVFTITPRTGALVLFPSWLQHFVHAYRGQRPRVCISCNATVEPALPA